MSRGKQQDLKTRFMSYVKISDGCWIWAGAIRPNGTGMIHEKGTTRTAHSVAIEFFGSGVRAKRKQLRQLCKTTSCVNPRHWSADRPELPSLLRCKACGKQDARESFPREGSRIRRKCKDCVNKIQAARRRLRPSSFDARAAWGPRFIEKTIPEPNSGCVLWLGRCNPFGYGEMPVGGKPARAHRLSYELWIGRIPPGMCVCHRCDTPPCVNPDHLFLGTIADNNRDCVSKKRNCRGEKWMKAHYPELIKKAD